MFENWFWCNTNSWYVTKSVGAVLKPLNIERISYNISSWRPKVGWLVLLLCNIIFTQTSGNSKVWLTNVNQAWASIRIFCVKSALCHNYPFGFILELFPSHLIVHSVMIWEDQDLNSFFFKYFYLCPPGSEASREVANLTERKICIPLWYLWVSVRGIFNIPSPKERTQGPSQIPSAVVFYITLLRGLW